MAVLPILKHPHPILREKAKKIKHIDASIQRLIDDMIDTLHDAPGVGLAAPQVGVPIRLFVVEVPDDKLRVLINPEIVKASDEYEVEEGCLSIPGYVGEVKRFMNVTVKGRDRNGREVRFKASDLLAQAIQHELDHLDGILFIDRLVSPEKLYRVTSSDATESAATEDAPVRP